MIARIETVGVHDPTGMLYADVSFWAGAEPIDDPDLRNDFLIQVRAFEERRVTNAAGYLQTRSGRWLMPQIEHDGEWVDRPEDRADPWQLQTVPPDQAAQLTSAIRDFALRAGDHSGDQRGIPDGEVSDFSPTVSLADLAGTVLRIE